MKTIVLKEKIIAVLDSLLISDMTKERAAAELAELFEAAVIQIMKGK